MDKPKIIRKGEKYFMLGLFGAVDLAQAALVETGVAGTIIDAVAGVVLLIYGLIRGLWTGKKLLILLATYIGEAIPIVNAFPFWVGDVLNLFNGTMTPEYAEEQEKIQALQNFTIPSQFSEMPDGTVVRNSKNSMATSQNTQNGQVKNGINPPKRRLAASANSDTALAA